MLQTTRAIVRSTLLAGVIVAASGSPAIAEQIQGSPASSLAAGKLSNTVSLATGTDGARGSFANSRVSTKSSGKICPECTHVKV